MTAFSRQHIFGKLTLVLVLGFTSAYVLKIHVSALVRFVQYNETNDDAIIKV